MHYPVGPSRDWANKKGERLPLPPRTARVVNTRSFVKLSSFGIAFLNARRHGGTAETEGPWRGTQIWGGWGESTGLGAL